MKTFYYKARTTSLREQDADGIKNFENADSRRDYSRRLSFINVLLL